MAADVLLHNEGGVIPALIQHDALVPELLGVAVEAIGESNALHSLQSVHSGVHAASGNMDLAG